MLLQYGPINLNLLSVDSYERQAVMHGPNYLGTKHRIAVTATFNPAVQSDFLQGDGAFTQFDSQFGGNVVDAAGNPVRFVPVVPNALPNPIGPLSPTAAGLPPLGSGRGSGQGGPIPSNRRVTGAYSATALKHELMQPRQQLVFSMGGTVLLQSPLPGFNTDAANGPIPISCDVVKMGGPRTFKVRFVVETVVNDAPLRGTGGSGTNYLHAVLSHRWSMMHDLSSDFFCRRIITGRLVFRTDVLRNFQLNPDDFRRYLFHPIPQGFARRGIKVKTLDDQATLDYEVTDEQIPIGWIEAGVTRVEGFHSVHFAVPDRETTTAKGIGSTWDRIATAISRGGLLKDFEINTVVSAGMELIGGAVGTLYNTLPVLTNTIHVHVWGQPSSTRAGLRAFATNIVNARLSQINLLGIFLGGQDIQYVDNIVGKEVTVKARLITGPITTVSNVGANVDFTKFFPVNDDTASWLVEGESPQPPSDDNISRDGTYLEICVAGALTGDAAQGAQAQFNPPAPTIRATPGKAPTTKF